MPKGQEHIPTRGVDEYTYEAGKATRIMPQDVHLLGGYTLRIIKPVEHRPSYAADSQVLVTNIEGLNKNKVSLALKDSSGEGVLTSVHTFNEAGFFVAHILGIEHGINTSTTTTEAGYLAGSIDPYDLALAALVAQESLKLDAVLL